MGALTRRRRYWPALWALVTRPGRTLRFFTRRDTPWGPKLLGLLSVLYVVMPVDLIPDLVPIFGWLDDAGLGFTALSWLAMAVDRAHAPADKDPEALPAPSNGR